MPFFETLPMQQAEDGSLSSVIYLDGVNPHGSLVHPEHDVMYEVESGEAIFCVRGVRHLLENGKNILITSGSPYDYMGKSATISSTITPVSKSAKNSLQAD